MPHLSPMSWLMAIVAFWLVMVTFTSNIWWANLHTFETNIPNKMKYIQLTWNWT
uniref:ATP synthase F0 subunit 8 n=1 Tax=Metaphire riukiuensis TaxID=585718 RepID=A0AA48K6S5_9ANNE|nr:ATP synthase F0 subunit 8 [Metaphire riukiuensis]